MEKWYEDLNKDQKIILFEALDKINIELSENPLTGILDALNYKKIVTYISINVIKVQIWTNEIKIKVNDIPIGKIYIDTYQTIVLELNDKSRFILKTNVTPEYENKIFTH